MRNDVGEMIGWGFGLMMGIVVGAVGGTLKSDRYWTELIKDNPTKAMQLRDQWIKLDKAEVDKIDALNKIRAIKQE